jgi:hypothetical protein
VGRVVLFVVEDSRLDALLTVVNQFATDPGVAVQELVQQFAMLRDARPWCRGKGRVVFDCTCRTLDNGQIEMTIAMDGVVVCMEVFTEYLDASDYAIGKMHAYDAN